MSGDESGAAGKICRDCGLELPIDEFWKRKASPDGLSLYCKACFKFRNRAAREARASAEGRILTRQEGRTVAVAPGMKYCPRCRQVLPLQDFVRNRSTSTGYGGYCRPCQAAKVSESIARNHGNRRHYHLKRRYSLGADDVLEMLQDQLWQCPICMCALTLKTAHVDHGHKTGEVRAVVCFNCNGGLGQFKDNPVALRRAAAYVEGKVWQPTKLAPGVYRLPSSPLAAPASPSSSATTRLTSFLDDVRRRQPL